MCPEKDKCIIDLLLSYQVLVAKSELFIVAHFIPSFPVKKSLFQVYIVPLLWMFDVVHLSLVVLLQ